MKRVTLLVLMLCLVLPGAWHYAKGVTIIENVEEGIPIEVKEGSVHSGSDKSNSIVATIDGHWLSVVFLENLGQVNIQVSRVNGGDSQIQSSPTPNGMDFYIQSTGDYVVYFTLPNNDVYYGEFEITD